MPARAAWKGFLQVHQLQVPVKAFTAVASQPEIVLNQLHAGCGARVRQLKVCPLHGELTAEEIGSGYEFAEGQYLPLDAQDLSSLLSEDTKAITVDCFVEPRSVDAVYHSGRTYYVVPDGPPGQRPFCVLRDGMRESDRYAVSRIVVNHREQLVLLRPYGRLLAMTVLEYPQRVRPACDYEGEVAAVTASPGELQLIQQLVTALTQPDYDVTSYRDHYTDGLASLIERRLAEHNSSSPAAPTMENVLETADDSTLVAALRASLAAAGVEDLPARIPSRTERAGSDDNAAPVPKWA